MSKQEVSSGRLWQELEEYQEQGIRGTIRLKAKPYITASWRPTKRSLAVTFPHPAKLSRALPSLERVMVRVLATELGHQIEFSTVHPPLQPLLLQFGMACAARINSTNELEETLRTTITDWRNLLKGMGGMSRAEEIGLFGELWALRRLADEAGPRAAFKAWTGPTAEEHDFRFGSVELEVKTTSKAERVHFIQHEKQLQASPNCQLLLLSIQIAAGGTGGETIGELRNRVESDLGPEIGPQLGAYLRKHLGLTAETLDARASRWKLRSPARLIALNAGSPRIVRSFVDSLPVDEPSRIATVAYQVNVEGLGCEDGSDEFGQAIGAINP